MSVSATKAYELSLLAEASYAWFNKIDYTDREQIKDLLGGEIPKRDEAVLSKTQVDDFLENYQVADHQPDTASGFSGTLFERITPKEGEPNFVFSLRGTQTAKDWQIDLTDLVTNGLAWEQIIDMYNYWQRLITPEGEACKQAVKTQTNSIDEMTILESIPPLSAMWNVSIIEVEGKGLGIVPPNAKVDVSGHSLGGHLATAFSRLFADQTNDILTINGAGYAVTGKVTNNITNLFSVLGGKDHFNAEKIVSLYGNKGTNIVTQDWYLQQPGQHLPLFLEVPSHSSSLMVDSAAVVSLLCQIDPTLGEKPISEALDIINMVLCAVSGKENESLERFVEKLAGLFLNDQSKITIKDREALYKKIIEIQEIIPEGGLKVVSLIGKSANEIIALAKTDIAYAYALVNLNPFVITGLDYSQFNEDGALKWFNTETKKGLLTDDYLKDRTAMLQALIERNIGNDSSLYNDGNRFDFKDLMLNENLDFEGPVIGHSGIGAIPIRGKQDLDVIFGSDERDEKDQLIGFDQDKNRSQHIYGGAGNDELVSSKSGNDHLEGGKNNDTYRLSFDTSFTSQKTTTFDIEGDDVYKISGAGIIESVDIKGDDEYFINDFSGKYTITDLEGIDEYSITGSSHLSINDSAGSDKYRINNSGITSIVDSGGSNDIYYLQGSGNVIIKDDGGSNIYHINGDGHYQIYDSSGIGSIYHNGQSLNAQVSALKNSNHEWELEGGYAFKRVSNALLIYYQGKEIASIKIFDFEKAKTTGFLGLKLQDYVIEELPSQPINNTITINYIKEGADKEVDDHGVALNIKEGSGANDRVIADNSVDNWIELGQGGNDRFEGGDGNDGVLAGSGDDILIGGAGRDVLLGGKGNDTLFANKEIDLTDAKAIEALNLERSTDGDWGNWNSSTSTTTEGKQIQWGDWLNGGAGDDTLVGSHNADQLYGGQGNDTIGHLY